jgi:FkbM family methyltransferase
MKLNKKKIKYHFLKIFYKRYLKFFNSFYKQKLNSVLIDLIARGVEINTVYDIGAYRGDFSNYLNNTSLKNRDFYLFEANIKNKKYLERFDYQYFINVLSDRIKEITFYSKSLSGDSYYLEQTNFYSSSDAQNLTTTTLDEIVIANELPLPEFIKIDTQGSELDILNGGKKNNI